MKWANTTNGFVLILGFDSFGAFAADGDTVVVRDSTGNALDDMGLRKFGTAATELLTQARKMVIPPNGSLTSSEASITFHAISVDKFEELRGFL